MHKFILFLMLSLAPTSTATFTYNGASGNWSDNTKWLGGVSPSAGSSSTSVQITSVAPTINLDVNATVNQLSYTQSSSDATLSTTSAKKITFDGTSATINAINAASRILITAPAALNQSLSISGPGSVYMDAMTSNAKDITVSNGVFRETFDTNSGIVGGNIYLTGGVISCGVNNGFGGSAGFKIVQSNSVATQASFGTNNTTQSNNVQFITTGSQPMIFGGGNSTQTFSGTFTGSISSQLTLGGKFTGDWSGFTSSVPVIVNALFINGTVPASVVFQLGTGLTRTASASNNVLHVVASGGGGSALYAGGANGVVLSGNLTVNSNQITTGSAFLNFNNTLASVPAPIFSGVISNAATGAANVTVRAADGSVTFSGNNTYTSPTSVSASSELCVNGSIASSSLLTAVGSASFVSGKGTVPTTTMNSSSSLFAYDRLNTPSVTDVLSMNGNLTMNASSDISVYTSATASSKLAVTGNVSFGSGVNLLIGAGSTNLTPGQSATIITYTGTSSGSLVAPSGYAITDSAGVITLTKNTYVYTGTAGNWTDTTKWQSSVSPLSGSTTAVVDVSSSANPISLDTNTTLNEFKHSGTGILTLSPSIAQTLTFDGTSPKITLSNGDMTITAPIVLNQSLTINANTRSNFLDAVTSSAKDITYNATGGTFRFTKANNTGIVGGNFFFNGSSVQCLVAECFGGSSGMKLVVSNSKASAYVELYGGTQSNPFQLVDTTSNLFTIGTTTSNVYAGAFTGSITHDLILSGKYTGDWSGFSTTAKIIASGDNGNLYIAATNFSTNKVQIGNGLSPSIVAMFQNASNPIDVVVKSSGGGTYGYWGWGTNVILSGNIKLNSTGVTTGAAFLDLNNVVAGATYSGIISNAVSGASNITLRANGGAVTLSGANTYTSPTIVNSNNEMCVTGSIGSSSSLTVNTAGVISGKGTIPSTTLNGASFIKTFDNLHTPAVTDVLTENGALTMSGTSVLSVFTSAAPASSILAVTGNVNFTAGASVVVDAGSVAMTTGQTVTIMTYTGTSTGTLTPPSGYTISDVVGTITLHKI